MRQLAKKMLLTAALVAASSSVCAGAPFDFDCMSPYVGLDYQHRWMEPVSASTAGIEEGVFATGFNNLKPRNSYAGLSLYAGARWDCIGLELGYDASFRNRKRWSTPNGIGGTFNGSTTSQVNGGHLDLVLFVPVMDCTELMLSSGIGLLNSRITLRNDTLNRTTTFSGRTSAVGRLRAGINYLFTECVGARFVLGYETTGSLRLKGPSGSTVFSRANEVVKPFNDSFTLSIGAFYKF